MHKTNKMIMKTMLLAAGMIVSFAGTSVAHELSKMEPKSFNFETEQNTQTLDNRKWRCVLPPELRFMCDKR